MDMPIVCVIIALIVGVVMGGAIFCARAALRRMDEQTELERSMSFMSPSIPPPPPLPPSRRKRKNLGPAVRDAWDEAERAADMWPAFNSAHEGYAVLTEEVDELKDHVWTNQKKRDLAAMRKEAIQVAAMAIRFATDVCDEEGGRR